MSTVAVEFRLTPEQRASLHEIARQREITVQDLLELTVFQELRSRQRKHRKPTYQPEELPFTG